MNTWRPSDDAVPQDQHLVVVGCLTKCLLVRSILKAIPARRFTIGRGNALNDIITGSQYKLVHGNRDYGVALATTTPWGKRLICCFGITAAGCYGASRMLLSQQNVELLAQYCGNDFELLIEVIGDVRLVKTAKVIAGNLKGHEFDTDIQSLDLQVRSPHDINEIIHYPTFMSLLKTESAFLMVPSKQYTVFAGT
ncbi:MAG: hypothetical protein WAP74_01040 [Patescibacteria group bacterium]